MKRLVIGITGPYASGKTTVAKIFQSLGAKVIDADAIAHKLIKRNTKGYKKIVRFFGEKVLKKNRTIDRKKLAAVVFRNKKLLKKLNSILHPEILKIIKCRIKNSKKRIIVLDAPLLIESNLHKAMHKVIVVKASQRRLIKRIKAKIPDINAREALRRISAQIPLKKKVGLADFIIDNNGSKLKTRAQVLEIYRHL